MFWLRLGRVAIPVALLIYGMATYPPHVFIFSLLVPACLTCIVGAWLRFIFRWDHNTMGYKNRFIHLEFPELGDDIWIDILNPLMAPASVLTSDISVETDDEGKAIPGQSDRAMEATYNITAKLIVRWNVYDALDPADDPAPLELPATVDKMKNLPMPIITRIMQEVGKVRMGTADESTSTTS